MTPDQLIRKELLDLLNGGEAHLGFAQAIADFPLDQINTPYPNCTYTPWHLLEHVRFCQWDILEYIRNPGYVAPIFPLEYWQPAETTADAAQWEKTIADFQADLAAFCQLLQDPTTDLYAPLVNGPQHNIFRCILVLADHNAYHLGEFAILRQTADNWSTVRSAGTHTYV